MQNYSLVIDTDPGLDDAVALSCLVAFGAPDATCYLSTYGNKDLDTTTTNLCAVLEYMGAECDVFRGSDCRLDGDEIQYTDYHGIDGLGGCADLFSSSRIRTCPELFNADQPLSWISGGIYIALGPLTNLARLIDAGGGRRMFDQVLIMGGGIDVFNMPHEAEYNFSCDPEAVGVVFSSQENIVLFPLDLTMQFVLDNRFVDAIVEDAAVYPLVARLVQANRETALRHGLDGAVLHDMLPIIYYEDCRRFSEVLGRVSIDSWGKIFLDSKGKEVTRIVSADRDVVSSSLLRLFGIDGQAQWADVNKAS